MCVKLLGGGSPPPPAGELKCWGGQTPTPKTYNVFIWAGGVESNLPALLRDICYFLHYAGEHPADYLKLNYATRTVPCSLSGATVLGSRYPSTALRSHPTPRPRPRPRTVGDGHGVFPSVCTVFPSLRLFSVLSLPLSLSPHSRLCHRSAVSGAACFVRLAPRACVRGRGLVSETDQPSCAEQATSQRISAPLIKEQPAFRNPSCWW